jgi:hypothetical protein
MAEAPLQAPLQNSTVQETQKGSAPPKPSASRWKNLKEKWKSKLENPKTLRNIAILLAVLVFASFACGGVFIHEYVYGQDAADDTGLNIGLLSISGLLVVVAIAFLCFLPIKKDTILNSQFLRSRTKTEKIGGMFLLGLLCVLLPLIFVIPGFYCALEYPNGDDWNRWLLAAGILFLVLGAVLLVSFFFMLWKFDVSGFRTFVLKLLPRKNKNANGTSSVPMGIAVMSRANENKLEKAVEKAFDEVTSHIETLPEGSEEQAVVALRFGNLIDKLDEAKSKGAITQIEQSNKKDIFEPSENEETNQIRRGSVQQLIAAFKDLK